MDIIDKIFVELKLKKKSQVELAEYLGIGKQLISEWKAKRVDSFYKYLFEISTFLNVSSDYLLGLSDVKQLDKIEGQFELSETEKEVIKKYRQKSPDIQEVIKLILNDEQKTKKAANVIKKTAAESTIQFAKGGGIKVTKAKKKPITFED